MRSIALIGLCDGMLTEFGVVTNIRKFPFGGVTEVSFFVPSTGKIRKVSFQNWESIKVQ